MGAPEDSISANVCQNVSHGPVFKPAGYNITLQTQQLKIAEKNVPSMNRIPRSANFPVKEMFAFPLIFIVVISTTHKTV